MKRLSGGLLLALAALALAQLAAGFYVPGVAPTEYADGDLVEIKVRGGY